MQQQVHSEKRSTLEGFDFFAMMADFAAEERKKRSKAEIIQLLRETGESYAKFLDGLSDAFLAESVSYPAGMQPPTKTRFEMILGPKEHEMHHRAQIMVMQRMMGLVPHLTRNMEAMRASMAAPKA
jgi:uncharacterized damage-inducible protein DinB